MNDTSIGAESAISLNGVNLSLGRGAARVHILKDIGLHIGRGEAIGLVGHSGSGKSTLLMVMAGLERPDTGTVVVAGENLCALDEDALARFRGRNVGIVFQSFHLIPTMTALENVAVPLELAGNARCLHAGARGTGRGRPRRAVSHYPAQLSGGEQQRVALARALAPNPAILVADEPTGNLDEATGRQVIDLLFAGHASRGTTLILVTHDNALAQRCDRVVRLRSGRRSKELDRMTSPSHGRPMQSMTMWNSMTMTQGRVPLWLKLAYTAFMAVLVPVYWHFYGPTNFLYFCDVSLFLTLVGVWLEWPLPISMCAVGLLAPQTFWVIDFLAGTVGITFTGMTAYMFKHESSLFLRALSLFHGWLPFLLAWLVWRLGYDRPGFLYWTLLALALKLVCFFFMPTPHPNPGLTPVNINYVWGMSDTAPQTWVSPRVWLAGMLIGMPLLLYIPTHLLLDRVMPKAPTNAASPTTLGANA